MNVEMPFGKFRGVSIQEVPTDYLKWLATIDLKPWMRRAVTDELELRAVLKAAARDDFGREPPGGGGVAIAGGCGPVDTRRRFAHKNVTGSEVE